MYRGCYGQGQNPFTLPVVYRHPLRLRLGATKICLNHQKEVVQFAADSEHSGKNCDGDAGYDQAILNSSCTRLVVGKLADQAMKACLNFGDETQHGGSSFFYHNHRQQLSGTRSLFHADNLCITMVGYITQIGMVLGVAGIFCPPIRAVGAVFEYETPATFGVESDGGQNDGWGCYCFALRNPPAFQAFPPESGSVARLMIPAAEWVSQAAILYWHYFALSRWRC